MIIKNLKQFKDVQYMPKIIGSPEKIPEDVKYYLENIKGNVGPITYEQFQREALCISNMLLCTSKVKEVAPNLDQNEVYDLSTTYLTLSRFITSKEYRPPMWFGGPISKVTN